MFDGNGFQLCIYPSGISILDQSVKLIDYGQSYAALNDRVLC